ncbi:MAG: type II toxin-antitoxin system HicB family antitoxin [Methanothrix sp.]|nr:type II toxin-antitoxin system HicB family antitoxin [Methanothrix sp.]
MFAEYIQAALRHAKYEVLEDDTYMATVEGLRGVIAVGDTIEECRDDLIGAIEGWVALGLRLGHTIPVIDGYGINVSLEPVPVVE